MDGPCNQFFTGSTFAVDQNRAAGGGDGADGLLQFFERRTCTDDVVKRVARGRVAPEGKVLAAERYFRERAGNGEFDLVHQSRTLADVIGPPPRLDRLHGSFVVIDRSHQNDRGFRRDLMRVPKNFDSIHARHLDVGNNHVEQRAVDFALGQFATGDGFHLVAIAAQGDIEQFADRALVVTDENVTYALLLLLA